MLQDLLSLRRDAGDVAPVSLWRNAATINLNADPVTGAHRSGDLLPKRSIFHFECVLALLIDSQQVASIDAGRKRKHTDQRAAISAAA